MMGRCVIGFVVCAGCSFRAGQLGELPDSAPTPDTKSSPDSHGFDDAALCPDADHDGVCDAVDDWPCGPRPTAPSATVTIDRTDGVGKHTRLSLSNMAMNGTNLLVVAPSAMVTYTTHYSIVDCICPGCIDQIEVGLVPGTRDTCVYDGNPQGTSTQQCGQQTAGDATHVLAAPSVSGVYAMRFRLSQDYACNDHSGWWTGNAPDASDTVALLCVH